MQERSRARLEQNLVPVAADVEPVEGADRRFRLALRIAEGGEVVAPDQNAGGRVHGRRVEPRLHPPGLSAFERQRRAAIGDAIAIVAGARAAPRVEIFAHALNAENRHGMGMKQRIEPLAEPERRPVALEIDMRDLAQSVDASVSAPRAMRDRTLSRHGEDRALQRLLDRKAVPLSLPADERRAVIFKRELEARHAELWRRLGGGRRRSLRREPRRCADRQSGRH